MILTPEQIAKILNGSEFRPSDVVKMADSHEALRAERDVARSFLSDLRRQMEEARANWDWPLAKVCEERDEYRRHAEALADALADDGHGVPTPGCPQCAAVAAFRQYQGGGRE